VAGSLINGSLAGTTVLLELRDSLTAVFLVPEVPAGSQQLTVDFGRDLRGTASVTLGLPPTVVNPRSVIDSTLVPLMAQADSVIAAGAKSPETVSQANLAFLRVRNAQIKSALAGANSTELRQIAAWTLANSAILATLPSTLTTGRILASPSGYSAGEVSRQVDQFVVQYVAAKQLVVGTVAACAVGNFLPGALRLVAGASCGVAIALQVETLREMVSVRLMRILAVAESIILGSPSSNVTAEGGQTEPAFGTSASVLPGLSVDPGVRQRITYTATFRSLALSDRVVLAAVVTAADELMNDIRKVLSFMTDWVVPDLYPPAVPRREQVSLGGLAISAVVPGCTVTPDETGAWLLCPQLSVTDLALPGVFTYQNAFGTASVSQIVTVRRAEVRVGSIQAQRTGGGLSVMSRTNIVYCDYSVSVPVRGNAPVQFTGLTAAFSNGTNARLSFSTFVDPRASAGLERTDQFFMGYGNNTPPPSFTVEYRLSYFVPHSGESGVVSSTLFCSP
jgi:hypothetical protein